ncbi:lipopolysaccharide assembly protein LapB [cf. Phormidesmis sp. LEGE 11477]|uniref:tetratricopeptide repeat protein n=1 Tax=cf. Phormidesmis sp. LEGE 11477 TaxID=1828680 RepID=UPI00187F5946|nr:hypothetical protein [cf. Phormidesmis sp. LEGE 11477]MBE9060732.1 hypothetical protein [cf. Phormidesmis sp. LEGE 11477]
MVSIPAGSFGLGVAKAQTTSAETTSAETAQSPRSGHQCYDLATEQPEPLGEFRTRLLDTAAVAARRADTPGEKAAALVDVSRSYACLGQRELAAALAEESLPIVEDLADVGEKGRLLGAIANIYGERLNDLERANDILLQVIELTKTTAEDSALHHQLSQQIVRTYAVTGQYANIRRYIDSIETISSRENALRLAEYTLMNSEADSDLIEELFPEFLLEEEHFEHSVRPIYSHLFSLSGRGEDGSAPLQQSAIDDLIEQEIQTIELEQNDFHRIYSYTNLADSLHRAGYSERAVSVLEKAIESLEDLQNSEESSNSDSSMYLGSQELLLYSSIVGTFFRMGEADRGLALIEQIEDSPEGSMKKISILFPLIFSFGESVLPAQASSLIAELEQTIRASNQTADETATHLVLIANAYGQIGEVENVRRITRELLTSDVDRLEALTSSGSVILLLSTIGDYEDAIALASSIDDDDVYSALAINLATQSQEDLAQRVFSDITSPVQQIQTLTLMAEEYHRLEHSDIAFDLFVQALSIAETAELESGEAYLDYYENSESWRRGLIRDIVYSADRLGFSERVQPLIENDSIRINFGLDSTDLETVLAKEGDILALPLEDSVLRSIASQAAQEQMFSLAIEAVAAMSSAYEQVKILTTITDCYVTSETTADAETIRLLEALADSYR